MVRFSKNTHISYFIYIRPVGAELLHADGRMDGRTDRQTDMMKLIVAFRKFANAPRIEVQENGSCQNFLLLFGTF